MAFINEIEELENVDNIENYIINKGKIPVVLTASHTMQQIKEDGSIKLSEPYTKAIALYVSKNINCNSLIKLKDTGIDSNSDNIDEFKLVLKDLIDDKNIKLLIDIHGASKDRDFDIELGTLNNMSVDYSTINELKEAFIENGINNIAINDPFKGGGITRYIYGMTDIDVIQIEINKKYRDIENVDNIEKVCNALISFIKQYNDKIM